MLRNAIFLLTKQQKCGIIWVKFAAIYVFWLRGEKIVGSIGKGEKMTKEWEYYLTKKQGISDMEESEFSRLWTVALKYIDKYTAGGADTENDDVMTCACAAVDCLARYENPAAPEVAAESADGMSTTFRSATDVTWQKNAELAEICRLYLPKELLYRGLI